MWWWSPLAQEQGWWHNSWACARTDPWWCLACSESRPFSFSPDNMGLLDPATSDGRVIFFLPWEKMTIAGTTDSPTDVTSHPIPTEEDINFILSEVRNYLSVDVEGRSVNFCWEGYLQYFSLTTCCLSQVSAVTDSCVLAPLILVGCKCHLNPFWSYHWCFSRFTLSTWTIQMEISWYLSVQISRTSHLTGSSCQMTHSGLFGWQMQSLAEVGRFGRTSIQVHPKILLLWL